MNKECETCIKRKTVYCPNSIECMATDDKPYYQNRIMLLEENKELKKKYENAVADYEKTMFEKEQLNSLVNSCQEEIRQLKKQLEEYKDKINWYENFEINKTIDKLRLKHNTQQKEFINYLEDNWKQTQDIWYIKILQKYKEITGVPMTGLDDEEEPDLFEMIEDMKNKPKYIEEIKLVEIQNLWDRDIEIEKKLKEITKAVNYLLDKDKK